MSLQSFTRKYDDNSTETGFQFTFYCDKSADSYKTKFTPSAAGKKAGLSRMIGRGISLGTSFARIPFTNKPLEQQASDRQEAELMDEFSKRYDMMSPQWHAEHDRAFEEAQMRLKQILINVHRAICGYANIVGMVIEGYVFPVRGR
jgi:hypothetical protein